VGRRNDILVTGNENEIYGHFTCDDGAGPLQWTRSAVFLLSGLDGAWKSSTFHKAPARGLFFRPLFFISFGHRAHIGGIAHRAKAEKEHCAKEDHRSTKDSQPWAKYSALRFGLSHRLEADFSPSEAPGYRFASSCVYSVTT
jgi:hypothetical protein